MLIDKVKICWVENIKYFQKISQSIYVKSRHEIH